MIKPQKVFFMAVDGVAPRAKMNQQRGRRFRSAKDAEILEKKAKERGEVLPTESRFDSNCITPGTPFMCRLHQQLKYFVAMKLTTDASWRECQIYLSGHETPGEGEHKIMDFIRHQRSQPNYDPNTRHCLYGLDADLIMLGLCSHEPHFSLLREEVKYGKNQNRPVVPEQTTFHLLHLSLMREYLDHEFSSLKTGLSFEYNLEGIIDDWVLMGFLVGNDFIPNIPHLHITNEALPILYKAYMDVLPTLGGYINEHGFLNLERFQKYLKKLSEFDYKTFNDNRVDFKQMFGKGRRKKAFNNPQDSILDVLAKFDDHVPASDQLIDLTLDDDDKEEFYDDDDEDSDDSADLCQSEFQQHKRDYYMNKLDYANVTPDVMKEQAYEYIRAIQWNLHYYYNGIVSWSWYYPHHYSPYISDIKDFSAFELNFELGNPFLPFEQLLAVLPAASKELLPEPFQRLMCNENSPLKEFYPEDFKTDLNGKKMEWEAVVLIPFINERLLLESMKALEDELSEEEKERNSHGPHLLYTYSPESLGRYVTSTLTASYFPDIENNRGKCLEIAVDYFRLPPEQIKKGLLDDCLVDVFFPGFPTLKHIKHTAKLKHEKVKVFQQASRGQNMMLVIECDEEDQPDISSLAKKLLCKCVYVNWPHLMEARVIGVSDGSDQIVEDENMEQLSEKELERFIKKEKTSLTKSEKDIWKKQMAGVKSRYHERYGIETGDVKVLIHATILTGIRYVYKNDCEVVVEKQWSSYPASFALQATVQDLKVHCTSYQRFKTMDDIYPVGYKCYLLAPEYYGEEGVIQPRDGQKKGRIRVKVSDWIEPKLSHIPNMKSVSSLKYMPGYILAQRLGISSHMLSRMTGTVYVQTSPAESMSPNKSNVGLNLKFNKKNEEIPGYSRKQDDGNWVYSQNALNIMKDYLKKFPDLFERLVNLVEQDVILVDDIFPDGGGRDYIHEVCSWIKTLPCCNIPRQKVGAEVLEETAVQEIEIAVRKAKEAPQQERANILQVRTHVLYRPVHMQAPSIPDSMATYQLYDRVVNVREGWTVPLGLRGTVIGIHLGDRPEDMTLDVVFDEEFVGGLALNCSPKRGYRMSLASLMNLSHGKRLRLAKNHVEQQPNRPIQPQRNAKLLPPQKPFDKNNKSPKKSNRNELPPRLQAAQQSTNQQVSNRSSNNPGTSSASGNTNRFNHSPDSPFVPHNIFSGQDAAPPAPSAARESQEKSFVTPKVISRNVQGYRQAPGFIKQSQNEIQSHSKVQPVVPTQHNTEFLSMWEGLKQLSPGNACANGHSPQYNKPAYGKQVSVEELFRSAMEMEEQPQLELKKQDPPMKRNPVQELLQYVCLNMNGGVPIYRYHTIGPMQHTQAEVTLPNGFKCRSVAAPNQMIAAENAADQALAILAGNSPGLTGGYIRPPMPQPFPGAGAIRRAPIMGGAYSSDLNVLRHPGPSVMSTIPDSYVMYNQQLAQHLQPQPQRGGSYYPGGASPHWNVQHERSQHHVPNSVARFPTMNNAIGFVPPQVSRNQAGRSSKGKPKPVAKESTPVDSVTHKLENVALTDKRAVAEPPKAEPSSSNEQKEEQVSRKKPRSRLAVKF